MKRLASWGKNFYDRWGYRLTLLTLFLLPLKLSFSYIALIPLIALWMIALLATTAPSPTESPLQRARLFFRQPDGALFVWISVALGLSVFGFAPLHSGQKLLALAFFAALACVVRDQASPARIYSLITALIVGQSIAGFYSILEGAFPDVVRSIFLGKVTESGQLALVIPVALGLVSSGLQRELELGTIARTRLGISIISALVTASLAITTAFLPLLLHYGSYRFVIPILFLVALAFSFGFIEKVSRDTSGAPRLPLLILCVALPLLLAALCVNLKRGPWAGVLIATIIYCIFLEKRLVPITLVAALGVLITIEPVRDRLLQSSQHFFIVGGRSELWSIGFELLIRYPLGIGFDNSRLLQQFSPLVPPELEHFHSNIINVATETGAIGIAIFFWWLWIVLSKSFANPRTGTMWMLPYALGCAFLSWQIAGLVEYNFGDSEVKLVAFALLGIVTALSRPERWAERTLATPNLASLSASTSQTPSSQTR